jgi:two-component system phosphate regulon response regulator OmpR
VTKRVLLIEDDPQVRRTIVGFLQSGEFRVQEADSAEAAIKIICSGTQFDVGVVDFWLGHGNAVPLLDLIREKLPSIPLILISGGGGNLDLEATRAVGEISGVTLFLQKPFRKSELIDAIASIVR